MSSWRTLSASVSCASSRRTRGELVVSGGAGDVLVAVGAGGLIDAAEVGLGVIDAPAVGGVETALGADPVLGADTVLGGPDEPSGWGDAVPPPAPAQPA
ncbi:MAG TPA: hypothetical protein VK393_04700, partial [Nocardioidaceae bacterium]|nr:hypothetical protein [Nocardioidaceae bacterium]